MAWFHRLKPLRGLPKAHIEPAGNGYSIIEACRAQGFAPREIDAQFVALGKDGRALSGRAARDWWAGEAKSVGARQAHELPRRHSQPPCAPSHWVSSF
jgi:hypothetical protein